MINRVIKHSKQGKELTLTYTWRNRLSQRACCAVVNSGSLWYLVKILSTISSEKNLCGAHTNSFSQDAIVKFTSLWHLIVLEWPNTQTIIQNARHVEYSHKHSRPETLMLIRQHRWEKITHCSWLNHFWIFNKNQFIFDSYSEDYAVL